MAAILQPCMSEKIGNNFFCIHCELKKWKITSLQIYMKSSVNYANTYTISYVAQAQLTVFLHDHD